MANTDTEAGAKDRRRRGRVPSQAERVKTTLLLDLDTVEWGKREPGGLSEIIRRLLRQEFEAQANKETTT